MPHFTAARLNASDIPPLIGDIADNSAPSLLFTHSPRSSSYIEIIQICDAPVFEVIQGLYSSFQRICPTTLSRRFAIALESKYATAHPPVLSAFVPCRRHFTSFSSNGFESSSKNLFTLIGLPPQ